VQHTLYTVLQDTSFFLPHHKQFFFFSFLFFLSFSLSLSFFSLCTLNHLRVSWWILFRPPPLAIEGSHKLTHFDFGLMIFRTFIIQAGNSCTLLCLYLASCTQKMHWRAHSLVDTVAPFLTILQFSSELSNNWGAGLPCLGPLWIYSTGQQPKALYLRVCVPVFPPFVYSCCIMVRTYHLHKSCLSTLAPLRHHSSRTLTSLFSSACIPQKITWNAPASPYSALDSHICV